MSTILHSGWDKNIKIKINKCSVRQKVGSVSRKSIQDPDLTSSNGIRVRIRIKKHSTKSSFLHIGIAGNIQLPPRQKRNITTEKEIVHFPFYWLVSNYKDDILFPELIFCRIFSLNILRKTYEASLVAAGSGARSQPCIVTGYPVLGNR
jgi:hypothetical protein